MSVEGSCGRYGGVYWKVMVLVLGCSLLAASGAQANTTDLFLMFDGITGGSTQKDHVGWSDILTVKWGVSATAPPPGSPGGETTKPVFQDLSWTQVVDQSIPPLFDKLVTGSFISKAEVDFASPTEGEPVYFKMEFNEVFLTSLAVNGATTGSTTVSGSFAYDSIKITFFEFAPDGSVIGSTMASYDLKAQTGSPGELATLFALGMSGPLVTEVPVPAPLWLFASGLAALVVGRRKSG